MLQLKKAVKTRTSMGLFVVLCVFVVMLALSGCANMGDKIKAEYGRYPYKLVAFDRGQYIVGEVGGGMFPLGGWISGRIQGGSSVLFAIETNSDIHMFNVPVELVSVTLVDGPPYTAGFLVSYNPLVQSSPAEVKGNSATYLVKKYAKEYYIRISERDFSNFIKIIQ